MELERVHAIQQAYRKVLETLARPGHIETVQIEGEALQLEAPTFKGTLVMMLMLLDAEVSFHVVSQEEQVSHFITNMTYAKATSVDEADYVFVLQDATETMLMGAMAAAKKGDLIDPQKSATFIMEVSEVSGKEELILEGPGIKNQSFMKLGQQTGWLALRTQKNSEYPLGIDMIFVDSVGHVGSLPRTTQVRRGGDKSWDM
ncbi:MAG: phosphonate C-P lyase system protein PhnH [Cellulosilyticaceae bacterium]